MVTVQNITITAARSVVLDVDVCSAPVGSVSAVATPVFPSPWIFTADGIHYQGGVYKELSFNQSQNLVCLTTANEGTAYHVYLTDAADVNLSASVTGSRIRVDIPFGTSYDPTVLSMNPCANPSLYKYRVTTTSGTNVGNVISGEIRLAFRSTATASTASPSSVRVCGLTVTQIRSTL